MATADDVLTQLDVAFSGIDEDNKQIDASSTSVENTSAQLAQVRSKAEELVNNSQALGFEDKVAVTLAAIEKTNEAQTKVDGAKQSLQSVQSELNVAASTLREAQAHIQSLKGLTAAPPSARAGPLQAAGSAPAPQQEPKPSTGPRPKGIPDDYPWGRPHSIAWSDLLHVCHGDELDNTSGGHLYGTNRPGKTEFPPEWDNIEAIGGVLVNVARNPQEVELQKNGEWYVRNHVEDPDHDTGIDVVAVVQPDGRVTAGWPLKGPRVRRVPDPGNRG